MRLRDVGADAERFVVGETADLAQQVGRGVDRRRIRPGHKLELLAAFVLRQDFLDAAESLLRFFFRTIWHNLPGIHDRAREDCAQAGLLHRPDGLEGALRTGVEKIVLADGGHAAMDRFDAAKQAAGVKMLRSKHAGAAVDALEPRHQFQIFPHRAQQNLVEMGMRVDEAGQKRATVSINNLFAVCTRGRSVSADFDNETAVDAHITAKRFALRRHRQDQSINDEQGWSCQTRRSYFPESFSKNPPLRISSISVVSMKSSALAPRAFGVGSESMTFWMPRTSGDGKSRKDFVRRA